MKRVLLYLSTLGLCIFLQAIQIIDDHSKIESLPLDFIKQSEYFQGILSHPGYKQPLQLPVGISTQSLIEFFEHSKDHFADVPLEQLTQYFVIANALLFNNAQQELLQTIYHQLQQLPSTISSIQAKKLATKKVLRHLLALPRENFDNELADRIYADQLQTDRFHKKVQNYVLKKYPEIAQYPLIFALPFPLELSPNKSIVITEDPENKIVFWGNSDLPSISIERINMFFTRNNQFDWDAIYLAGANSKHYRFYINPKALITLFYRNTNRSVLTITDLSTIVPENQKWSHAAFSVDGSKITASIAGHTYLIDYDRSQLTPLKVPQSVFSSILLAKDKLLYRTQDRKTYLFDLQNQTSKSLSSNLDYYIMAVQENAGIRVYGLEQNKDSILEKSELIQL